MNVKSGALLAALATVSLATSTSRAMQMELSRPQLCGMSTTVVLAQVTSVDTVWSTAQVGGLERHAFLDVDHALAGTKIKGGVVVLPGGTMGDFRHWVEDVPELEVGVPYVLFLKALPEADGTFEVIGGEAGAVQVADDTSWAGETLVHITKSLEGCDAR